MALIENDTTRSFLSPILEFLDDDKVTEILVNAPSEIFVERGGRLYKTDSAFYDADALFAAVRNIAQYVGRRINEDEPILDARLPDGSRIHIVIPPCAKDGIYMTIRKFGQKAVQMKDLISFGALSVEMARTLHIAIQLKKKWPNKSSVSQVELLLSYPAVTSDLRQQKLLRSESQPRLKQPTKPLPKTQTTYAPPQKKQSL